MTIKPQRPPQTEINSVIELYSNLQEALNSVDLTKANDLSVVFVIKKSVNMIKSFVIS